MAKATLAAGLDIGSGQERRGLEIGATSVAGRVASGRRRMASWRSTDEGTRGMPQISPGCEYEFLLGARRDVLAKPEAGMACLLHECFQDWRT